MSADHWPMEEQPDGSLIPVDPTELAQVRHASLGLHIDFAGDDEPEGDEVRVMQLEREVRQLRNARDDVAWGASIKLAAGRMVLARLLEGNKLIASDKMAVQGVFDMLPAGAPKPERPRADDALPYRAQKRIGR